MDRITYKKGINVRYEYDIAVIGSGMAGIGAAIGAACQGCSVILIERFGVPGGNLTTGGVDSFCGNTIGQGKVFDMIVKGLEEFQAIAPVNPYKSYRHFNHNILELVLQELLLKHSVKVLLHTRFVDVICADGHISECLVCGPSGLEAVRARQFIDCTGEGELAARAGFSVMKGGPGGYQLPMSLMYFVREVDESQRKCEIPEGWFEKIDNPDQLPMISFSPNGINSKGVKIKVPMFDSTDTESLTGAEIHGRRKMMAIMDYHQRIEKRNWIFDHCSPMIGIREGRRITGDYILTVEDLQNGRSFEDSVAVGTFYLDAHKPDNDKKTYILPTNTLGVPPYDIPLRALIAKDGNNLMMAGRCLSADQLALSSARVSTTCTMSGEAAGTTAAIAVKGNKDIRSVPAKEVQDIMLEGGAILDKQKVSEVYLSKQNWPAF